MYNNQNSANTFSEKHILFKNMKGMNFDMERKKKSKNSGVYIAVCSCALIVAIVGYANRLSLKEPEKEKAEELAEVIPSPAPEVKVAEVSQKAEVEEQKTDEEPAKEPEKKVEATPEQKAVVKKEPEVIKFVAPVKGKVIEEYLGDDIVYNEALKDWRSHCGVDFEAELGDEVKTSANGIVEKVFDCEMGRCVIIDHKNGFRTMYANLNEDTKVNEGDEIKVGDTIGTVGNTALGDITDLPHVHFEMMKDGNNINPIEYLN